MEFSSIFPGFRFSPTDIELISHYLKKKITGDSDKCDDVIPEVDICKFEPWDLPAKSIIKSDHEWFFFSPSGRKYPNGSQAKRATEVGFWKATGKERGIKSGSHVIGTKRTLVFHVGRAPKGERTEWIMHEYCMKRNKNDKHQDPYVICRIRNKHEVPSTDDNQNCEIESNTISSHTTNNNELYADTQVGVDVQPLQTYTNGENRAGDCSPRKQTSSLEDLFNEKPDASEINEEGHNFGLEDNCFADIMKDDIIKLDDISAYSTPLDSSIVSASMRNIDQESITVMPQRNHRQGTAQRRIRLQSNPMVATSKNGSYTSVVHHETKSSVKSFMGSRFSHHTVNSRLISVICLILVLLVLFLLLSSESFRG